MLCIHCESLLYSIFCHTVLGLIAPLSLVHSSLLLFCSCWTLCELFFILRVNLTWFELTKYRQIDWLVSFFLFSLREIEEELEVLWQAATRENQQIRKTLLDSKVNAGLNVTPQTSDPATSPQHARRSTSQSDSDELSYYIKEKKNLTLDFYCWILHTKKKIFACCKYAFNLMCLEQNYSILQLIFYSTAKYFIDHDVMCFFIYLFF